MSRDYLNDGEYSEFQVILDKEFEKAQKLDANECVKQTIKLVNELAKQLNDDDCYEVTSKLKDFFIWCQR